MLTVFAGLAMLLAAIGIYGVCRIIAVGQRTAEIGIRLALGAEARDILAMIVGGAMRLAALGLGIGVVLALALTRTLTTLLYETAGTDPLTFGSVVAGAGRGRVHRQLSARAPRRPRRASRGPQISMRGLGRPVLDTPGAGVGPREELVACLLEVAKRAVPLNGPEDRGSRLDAIPSPAAVRRSTR